MIKEAELTYVRHKYKVIYSRVADDIVLRNITMVNDDGTTLDTALSKLNLNVFCYKRICRKEGVKP